MACPARWRLVGIARCVASLSLLGVVHAQTHDLSWRGHVPAGPAPSFDGGIPIDYDGDGDLDVLVKSGSVLVGQGGNGFTWSPPGDRIPMGSTFPTSFAAAGDVDGDGRVDLVRIVQFAVLIHRGLPGGYFAAGTPAGQTASWLFFPEQLVDADGDGDLDFFAFGSNTLVQLRNQGNGTFVETSATLPAIPISLGSAFADFDGDQAVDIVCASNGSVQLLRNNGAGVFTVAGAIGLPAAGALRLRAADADADGDVDVLMSMATSLQLWLNNGGVFSQSAATMPAPVLESALVDLDGDNRAEIVQCDRALGRMLVFANAPAGFTAAGSAALEEGWDLGRPLPGDLEGDGDLDLILGGTLAYLNQGNLQFRLLRELPVGITDNCNTVVPLDADADGATDVFCGDTLHRNRGDGFFTRTTVTLPPANVARAAVDLDGDTDVDVVWTAGNVQSFGSGILRNQGASWLTQTPFAAGDVAGAVFVGDFDGDGRPDLTSSSGRVLRNTVAGFQVAATLPPVSIPRAIGDFDGDGDPDLVVTNGGTWQLLQNQGAFVFQATGTPQNVQLLRASARDLDADGDVDLVTRHDQGGARLLTVWLNSGGVLQATSTLPEINPAVDIALDDVDDDGRPDIVSGRVFVNQGNGAFAPSNLATAGVYPGRAFDVDADGDADLVRAGAGETRTHATVSVNRRLQLAAPRLPILGRQHRLQITSRPGPSAGLDMVIPALATARIAPAPIPGVGVLHLDPAATVLLPWMFTAATGIAEVSVALPATTSLAGVEVFWQAAVLQPGAARLTNFLRDQLLAP
jgi:hypothetical protein